MFKREFRGPWNGYGATHPSVTELIQVETSKYSPQDLYVAAGCQKGYIHLTTAFTLAENLLEAVEATIVDLPSLGLSLEVKDPRGGIHIYNNVAEVRAAGEEWAAFTPEGSCLTGPHSIGEWTFRFIENPLMAEFREKMKSRKKGGEVGAEKPSA